MRLNFKTDEGAVSRAKIGLIVLQTDETIEPELARMLAIDGVALHFTRIRNDVEVTEVTLRAMENRIPDAMSLFPEQIRFDSVGYACTSGATVIGSERVAAQVRSALPENGSDVKVTDPLTAVKAACRALGLRRIGFVTPYIAEVSAAMRSALEADGIEIAGFGSFECIQDSVVARISQESVLSAILQTGRESPCDGVFASCTNLRTSDILERAEKELGLPVISSNQALGWHLLRCSGIDEVRTGYGQLLQTSGDSLPR